VSLAVWTTGDAAFVGLAWLNALVNTNPDGQVWGTHIY